MLLPLPGDEGSGVRASRTARRRPLRAARLALRAFARGTRAAAGLELALGCALALLPVSWACFDLYSRVEADTVGARVAAVMADYVSRGPKDAPLGDPLDGKLDGKALEALGEFLHEREFGGHADLVFVISAVHQPAGTPAPAVEVLWSDDSNLRFGVATVTAELAGAPCSRFVEDSGGSLTANLPADFTMAAGEVTIIVEVCARITSGFGALANLAIGDLYRLHVLPARSPERDWVPANPPVFAALDGGGSRGPLGPLGAAAPTLVAAAVLPAREDGPPAARTRLRSRDVAGPLRAFPADRLLPSPPGRAAGGEGPYLSSLRSPSLPPAARWA